MATIGDPSSQGVNSPLSAQPMPPGGPSLAPTVPKQAPRKLAQDLVQCFVNDPSPLTDGSLKNHAASARLIAHFALYTDEELEDCCKELAEIARLTPNLKSITTKLDLLISDAKELENLLLKNASTQEIQLKLKIIPDLAFVQDLLQARFQHLHRAPPQGFTDVKSYLQQVEKIALLYRQKNIAELAKARFAKSPESVVSLQLRRIVPENILNSVEAQLFQASTAKESIIACLRQGKIVEAELLLHKLKNDYPAVVDTVREQIVKECQTSQNAALRDACTRFLQAYSVDSDGAIVKKALAAGIAFTEIKACLGSQLLQRFEQIHAATASSTTFETANLPTQLTEKESLLLAAFIQENIQPVIGVARRYFLPAETGLARPVHFDWQTREVFVIADEKASKLKANGTYKKALNAAMIPLDTLAKDAALSVVQLTPVAPKRPTVDVTVDVVDPTTGNTTQKKTKKNFIGPLNLKMNIEDIEKEKPFYVALKGVPGVARLRAITDFQHEISGIGPLQKSYSLVFNRAERGELTQVVQTDFLQERTISSDQVKKMGHQLISTMAAIQERGVFHGDLKLPNVLVDANYNLLVTDFGLSFFVPNEGEIQPNFTLRDDNAYGAWWYTPLDMLEHDPSKPVPERTAEDYKKIESWVVGCILREMSYGRTNWFNTLMNAGYPPQKRNKNGINKLSQQALAAIQSEYQEKIVGGLLIEQIPIGQRTFKEHYIYAFTNLMQKDPAKRWLLKTADAYLKDPVAWEQEYVRDPVAWKARYGIAHPVPMPTAQPQPTQPQPAAPIQPQPTQPPAQPQQAAQRTVPPTVIIHRPAQQTTQQPKPP